jgi:tripartite-type tricarboxylate transporter receptor subunit TctC
MKAFDFLRTCTRGVVISMALSALALAGGAAHAATWPSKPVRFVVCFPPGNSADVFARAVSPMLTEKLGQPVVVDNRAGASGMIGVETVAKAAPDGYTIGVCSLSPITILPAVRHQMPYDVERDLASIILSNTGSMVLVVKKDSPFNTLSDLVDYAKAHPGKLTYGSLGPGTISQMTTEAFKMAAVIDLTEVGYKGAALAMTDLIGGHIDLMLDSGSSALAQMTAGTVKALAISSQKRTPLMPEVPTMSESHIKGLESFDFFGWVGFFAPAGTPPEIVDRLNKEIAEILKTPDVEQRARATGQEIPAANSPEQFRAFIRADYARWSNIARKLKLDLKD